MSWIYVIVAGLFEIMGVSGMNRIKDKVSAFNIGYTIIGFGLSFALLTLALQALPMGTAYAVWTGIGAAGSALIGIIKYKESKSALRLFFIALIIASVIGLKLFA